MHSTLFRFLFVKNFNVIHYFKTMHYFVSVYYIKPQKIYIKIGCDVTKCGKGGRILYEKHCTRINWDLTMYWQNQCALRKKEHLPKTVKLWPDIKTVGFLQLPGLSMWFWGFSYKRQNIHTDCWLSTCQAKPIFPGDSGWVNKIGQWTWGTPRWQMVEGKPDVHHFQGG